MQISVRSRFNKTWEGIDPFVVLQIQVRVAEEWQKSYLILDARTQSIAISQSKPEGLNPSGNLAALLRKYAPSGGLGTIWRDEQTGDIWLPLFTEPKPVPTFYLQLGAGSPNEIRFLKTGGSTLVRRSNKGSYTKAKPIDQQLPHEVQNDNTVWTDITDSILTNTGLQATTPTSVQNLTAITLPEFQRTARDRVARRLKTIKKSLQNRLIKSSTTEQLAQLKQKAALIAANLHQLQTGVDKIEIDNTLIELDPQKSPGQNLDHLYVLIKKVQKSLTIDQEQTLSAKAQIEQLTTDLANLRAGPMSQAAVEKILIRNKLALVLPTRRDHTGTTPVAQAWRQYLWETSTDAASQKIPILVGKSAAGSDALCRAARGNDWWFHAVGSTGSHVIIPARSLRGASPSAGLIRAAAILAVNFSQRREDYRGEVYISRRQFIRKRPGMAPGLWQIDKAESLFISYDDEELQKILAGGSSLVHES